MDNDKFIQQYYRIASTPQKDMPEKAAWLAKAETYMQQSGIAYTHIQIIEHDKFVEIIPS